jgi:hypothetical protein
MKAAVVPAMSSSRRSKMFPSLNLSDPVSTGEDARKRHLAMPTCT